jgi:uncharacterized protein
LAEPTSIVDLARLSLSFGEARRLEVPVRPGALQIAGQNYWADPDLVQAGLDVSRTSSGFALRLRVGLRLDGPCMRCLDPAHVEVEVDAREVDQPESDDEELRSPYVDAGELDVGAWVRDAVSLALPAQLLCRSDCAGLCPVCGESLNDADTADHTHDEGGDPRWAKLRELQGE